MRFQAIALFAALQLVVVQAESLNRRHVLLNRQAPGTGTTTTTTTTTPPPQSPPGTTTTSGGTTSTTTTTPSSTTPGPTTTSGGTNTSTTTTSVNATTTGAPITTTGPPPLDTGTTIPPLANITLGMPTKLPLPVPSLWRPGMMPPVPGAPPLPQVFALDPSKWPPVDKVPPTDTPEVRAWMKELEGFNIPGLNPTVDGSCVNDTAAAADAANRGWWTCGGHTRDTDIVACPDKYTWGVSFDDGPSQYTQVLLNYLEERKLKSTFFVVGSRVIDRPGLVVEEYMLGHEISVHTWSHRPLTMLTTEQVVAELGWTRKAIKETIGVTPTTMRPPYGDIDDRVRAISLAMGMVPIMWTKTPDGGKFDTNDWRVAGGIVNGTDSFNTFQNILTAATTLDTGFIVLQHDLYEITVNLAVGYTLNAAINHNPKFTLKAIGECSNIPPGNLYLESNRNETFPYRNSTAPGIDIDGDGTVDTQNGNSQTVDIPVSGSIREHIPFFTSMSLGVAVLYGLLL